MLVYTLVGILLGVAALITFNYYRKQNLSTGKLAGVLALYLIGMLFIAFSISWGYASVIEGEPQAMAIGFLVFGGIGVVLCIIAFRVAAMTPKADTKRDDVEVAHESL